MLQLLLKHIAEIEVRDKNNKTPLHFSSLNNSTEGAQLLFQHNEGIKKWDKDNRTQLLLQHNADANAKDIENWTPLQNATSHSCLMVVQLLIEHNAEIELSFRNNRTPLDHAAASSATVTQIQCKN